MGCQDDLKDTMKFYLQVCVSVLAQNLSHDPFVWFNDIFLKKANELGNMRSIIIQFVFVYPKAEVKND